MRAGTTDEERAPTAVLKDPAYAVFDDLTDVVVALDASFEIVYVNDFTLRLLGYERDAILGRSVSDYLRAEDIVRAPETVGLPWNSILEVDVSPNGAFRR